MDQQTVFISYRRTLSKHLARLVYKDLRSHGWDVFLDVNTMDSGDFDRIILNQIGARAHFILLISPDSLARCATPGDWVLREIEEAVRLNRNIVPIVEDCADFTREMAYLPPALRAVMTKKNALALPDSYFDEGMERLRTRFLKAPEYVTLTAVSADDRAEVSRRMGSLEPPLPPPPAPPASKPRTDDLLPAPFAWMPISAGTVTLSATASSGQASYLKRDLSMIIAPFSMAKYPVTNAQFRLFVEAGGYRERRWWTDAGWASRDRERWTAPRHWDDAKWNRDEQPVVGVSWYECMAFCQWLSEQTGESIMLPSEAQWQFAAQGSDRRTYPWGNTWDGSWCNNNVDGKGRGTTTSVRQYESKGDSPFGVVDMAGNVWEWCLTDYDSGINSVTNKARHNVLRGGYWNADNLDQFRCGFRDGNIPHGRNSSWGLRLACSASSF